MNTVWLCLLCLLLAGFTTVPAVDKGNFKKCADSSFCQRNRNLTPGESRYSVSPSSLTPDPEKGTLSFHIQDTSGVTLFATLQSLRNGVLRFSLKEFDPVPTHERFSPSEFSLDGDPTPHPFKVLSRSDSQINIQTGETQAEINLSPFRLSALRDGQAYAVVNERGLMNFEPFMSKEAWNATGINGDGNWEENFKSHRDSRPFGPGSVGVDVRFLGAKHLYGLPEHSDGLSLSDTKSDGGDPYRLYNLDVFEFEANTRMSLYGSVPLVQSIGVNGSNGFFWMNAAETWVDVEKVSGGGDSMVGSLFHSVFNSGGSDYIDSHWISESGLLDFFILPGPTTASVSEQYAELTGVTPLPPIWALGYHQCRWNYKDQEDVAQVDANLEANLIPYDAIWLDIEHTDGKKYFTWDANKFPDSTAMIDRLAGRNHKLVVIIDPHIKREDSYRIYKDMKERGLLVKSADGSSDYEGACWPGSSSWPDFLLPEVRRYWSECYLLDNYSGSTTNLHVWNDMNEPSVFTGPEITMHKDALHAGKWEHRDVHNLYGLLVTLSTYQGLLERSKHQERPFILTRAVFSGSQRYSAVWTGDNEASWAHLKIVLPMLLQMGLGGIPFVGSDVGGFFKHPSPELLVRWYQMGAYSPFFRQHAHIDTPRREPWLFGEDNLRVMREAVTERYQLLPYWYTTFYTHTQTGAPVLRPLWYEFPGDPSTWGVFSQAMLGPALMVIPVTEIGQTSLEAYFPEENAFWYDKKTFDRYPGGETRSISTPLDKIPVFLRGGSIVPFRMRVRRSANPNPDDPFTLYVALDQHQQAAGSLYWDDGHTFSYREGNYLIREFSYQTGVFSSRAGGSSGTYPSQSWIERILIIGLKGKPLGATLTGSGKELTANWESDKKTLEIRKPIDNIKLDVEIKISF